MSKLDRLLAKPKEYDIGGLKLKFMPLKTVNLDLIMKMSNKEAQVEALKEVITMTLKESVPETTDEEINNIGINHLVPILESILDVNGLSDMIDKKKALTELSPTSETTAK